MSHKKALLLIDLQNDFCLHGSLAVPGGDEVIALANALQPHFDCIIATQDWHPHDHLSFAANHPDKQIGDEIILAGLPQLLWPVHCVQHSKGAEFHPQLNTQKITRIFHKGTEKKIDSYSAFFDNAHLRSTGLGDYLHQQHVKEIYLMGLATDYCVKYSALDAKQLGFEVYVIEDACRGVELKAGDIDRAIMEMKAAGVHFIKSKALLSPLAST
jgi:nicotinamidase/pyrazinamidase